MEKTIFHYPNNPPQSWQDYDTHSTKNSKTTKKNKIDHRHIITTTLLSTVTWFVTLGICYKYRPISKLFQMPYPKTLLNNFIAKHPITYRQSLDAVYTASNLFVETKLVKNISTKLNLNKNEIVNALAENFVFFKITFPLWLPAHFMTSVHIHKS